MKAIGLDIGTSTICAVLIDADDGNVHESKTIENSSFVLSKNTWEKIQNPAKILEICNDLIDYFTENYNDILGIGITGQMHGILYCDENGKAVTPFYTWQDSRGNLQYKNGQSYADFLTEKTGYFMASGFGLTTHFYNKINGLIPKNAVVFCNIQDYIAMKLANTHIPFVHPSNSASFGVFDIKTNLFDVKAMQKAGVSADYLPNIYTDTKPIGKTESGLAVCCAIGDNQASFFGSAAFDDSILVNVGTGSQVSVLLSHFAETKDTECRPYLFNNYLMVGCGICGGYSYNLLKNFFEQTLKMFGENSSTDFFDTMNAEANKIYSSENKLKVHTQFRGTRQNPALRGSINEISSENFTPQHLILGFLEGICDELYLLYKGMDLNDKTPRMLVGSGNGIRKNELLQKIFSDRFGMEIKIPQNEEEAAFGVSLLCLYATGYVTDLKRIQSFIKYQN